MRQSSFRMNHKMKNKKAKTHDIVFLFKIVGQKPTILSFSYKKVGASKTSLNR